MQRDDGVYLGHMLDTARKVVAKAAGTSRAAFDADEDLRMALAHLIQIIGEAAARVSPATRQANPQVPWRRITGMRHRIVHDYMNINADILWEVATRSLPDLVSLLELLVPPEEPA
ncbi:MAG: DUF86 domain-containing protein [Planctomycetes bacterium]|nr:DUF86 domain-containing protein [Planctomycetota bacterium]